MAIPSTFGPFVAEILEASSVPGTMMRHAFARSIAVVTTGTSYYRPSLQCKLALVRMCGGGGGGGSGARHDTNGNLRGGGAGGGGAGWVEFWVDVANQLGSNVQAFEVIVGAGGAGGAAVASNNNGAAGSDGAASIFGQMYQAGAGKGGGGGLLNSAGGVAYGGEGGNGWPSPYFNGTMGGDAHGDCVIYERADGTLGGCPGGGAGAPLDASQNAGTGEYGGIIGATSGSQGAQFGGPLSNQHNDGGGGGGTGATGVRGDFLHNTALQTGGHWVGGGGGGGGSPYGGGAGKNQGYQAASNVKGAGGGGGGGANAGTSLGGSGGSGCDGAIYIVEFF